MTENEAIEWLKVISATQSNSLNKNSLADRKEALHMAIVAVEELEQYRAIGTVEECWEARERQRGKKPIIYKDTNRADCPICGATVRGIKEPFGDWCSKCGQKLDWSE